MESFYKGAVLYWGPKKGPYFRELLMSCSRTRGQGLGTYCCWAWGRSAVEEASVYGGKHSPFCLSYSIYLQAKTTCNSIAWMIYIYIYIYIYICLYTHTHIYIYTCIYRRATRFGREFLRPSNLQELAQRGAPADARGWHRRDLPAHVEDIKV